MFPVLIGVSSVRLWWELFGARKQGELGIFRHLSTELARLSIPLQAGVEQAIQPSTHSFTCRS